MKSMKILEYFNNLLHKPAIKEAKQPEEVLEVLVDHTIRIERLEKMVMKLIGASGGRPKKTLNPPDPMDAQPDTQVYKETDRYLIMKDGTFRTK